MKFALRTTSLLTALLIASVAQAATSQCAPAPSNFRTAKDGLAHLRVVFPIVVGRDGQIRWNGRSVSDSTFKHYLSVAGQMNPEPQLVLDVTNGPACKRLYEVRQMLARAPICKHLCSEGAHWRTWQITGGP